MGCFYKGFYRGFCCSRFSSSRELILRSNAAGRAGAGSTAALYTSSSFVRRLVLVGEASEARRTDASARPDVIGSSFRGLDTRREICIDISFGVSGGDRLLESAPSRFTPLLPLPVRDRPSCRALCRALGTRDATFDDGPLVL